MNDLKEDYDAYQEMKRFYSMSDPSEEDQFRFVEAMEYLIKNAYFPEDIPVYSFNLAIYYRDIKNFTLEKKYLEICEQYGNDICKEQLGFIWYYGLCGQTDYKKAFSLFNECDTPLGLCMIADMYLYGQYVNKDRVKSRSIIEDLFIQFYADRKNSLFIKSTVFPEIALRLAKLDLEDGTDDMLDLDSLLDSREILTIRQQHRPFWGNLKVMRRILETTVRMLGNEYDFIDLYDLMTFELSSAVVTFDYNGMKYRLDIFRNNNEIIYQFDDIWFHGPDDFMEKVRINNKRITSIIDQIKNIHVED